MKPTCATSEQCAECAARFGLPFCDLPDEALREFDRISKPVAFRRGSVLFVEGHEPAGIYVICEGTVKLVATSADGRAIITQLVGQGEALGLSAVVSGRPLLVTARALERCVAKFAPKEVFLRFLRSNGDVCLRVAQHISRSYYCANQLVRNIGLAGTAPERLARLLLDRCSRDGASADGMVRLPFTLTHEEVAQMIGASRETVTRAFGDLRRRSIVERRGRVLVVRDAAALADMAQPD